MANLAAFTINSTPSSNPATGDRLFVAANGQTLSMQLENPLSVLSARYELFDPFDPESPLASKGAPLVTWNENGLAAITVDPAAVVTFDVPGAPAPPATGIYSYLVRCTVSTAGNGTPESQVQVFERMVVVESTGLVPSLRKTVPGESTQAEARGWSDEINDIIDGMQNLTVGATIVSAVVSAQGQYTVPVGVTVGDLVYITGTDAADKASNAALATMPVAAVVIAKPTTVTATLLYSGRASGFAGMTPGAMQYAGVNGARIESGSLPSAPGSVIQQVGVAVSADQMIFSPKSPIVL